MKRNLSQSRRAVLKSFGLITLACSLLAGPGLSGVAYAVDSGPTPTPSPSSMTVESQAAPLPAPTPSGAAVTPAPAPTTPPAPPATTPPTTSAPAVPAAKKLSKEELLAAGGAQMGQRSARVTHDKAIASGSALSTQSLSTEGTWSPTSGVLGLDVSKWQPSVDWQGEWNKGARFAYVKASEGTYYTNELFNSQYQGARNVGMIRGAYHFAHPSSSSGAAQARFFVNNGGGWSADGYTLPPVLDIEYNPYDGNTCYDMTPAQMTGWIQDFGSTMLALTGRLPVIYSTTDWWTQCTKNSASFSNYPLWIAAYPMSPASSPGVLPAGWSTYSIWQYSSQGPFAGDSNVWNGDYASLQRFAGTGAAAIQVPAQATQQIEAYASSHPALGSLTTPITCGLTSGGCYQGFQGGTVMWSAASKAFAVSAGPVTGAWQALGAERSAAGYPTSDLICGLKNGGCFQNFQGGSIMSSPATGAAFVPFGPIRDAWAAQGYENGSWGYPTSNATCGLRYGGCFQLFQAGSVLWSTSSGAHLVKSGPVLDAWAKDGFENGLLGFPSKDATCTASDCTQLFTGGVIGWTSTSGAWPVYMGIGDTWKAARAKGEPIGLPVAKEVCGLRGGGCYQLFQGGSILFSPATGAYAMTGKILNYWAQSGFENGKLGYPTGPASCGAVQTDCWQSFEKGTVAYSPATTIQTVPAGPMVQAWTSLGASGGALGYPTSAQICGLKDGGCFQMFAKGALMYSPAAGAQPSLLGPIRDFWQKQGFENGALGYPASNVICGLVGAGCFQNYLGGTVMWSNASGAHAMSFGPVRDAWIASGFENGILGYPTSEQMCGLRNGGCFQNFVNGTVMYSPATGAQTMSSAPIRDRWATTGFEGGSLGYPTSGAICGLRNGGCFQNFEKGTIMWSAASGAQVMMPGPIQQSWAGQGFENGALAFPTSGQTCTSDKLSCSQTFQGGTITWSSTAGVKTRLN
ncbi:lysozyme M1 [Pseudarthrobacter sp. C4D7]|nr:lysozyme M1 [Pseudarthrobacter sp. C4D7]